jgi:hypothetical protein
MIAAFTADAWSTAQITLDDGGGAQVFTVPAGVANAYDAAEEFRDWVDGTFGDLSAWTWARDTTTGAAVITFSLPLGYTMSTNAAAQIILGADAAGGPGMTSTDWTAPAGTIAPMTVGAGAMSINVCACLPHAGALRLSVWRVMALARSQRTERACVGRLLLSTWSARARFKLACLAHARHTFTAAPLMVGSSICRSGL